MMASRYHVQAAGCLQVASAASQLMQLCEREDCLLCCSVCATFKRSGMLLFAAT